MKFYDRENEIKELEKLYMQSDSCARMAVITGRRRIGKTQLSLKFAQKYKSIYLFVSKKPEKLLCEGFVQEIKQSFDIPVIGEIISFKDIFSLLLEISKKEKFVLIIDEFQEFYKINPSVYSDIQYLWDVNKNSSKMFVIFIGSVYSMMYKIFEHSKEPLFGRADRHILLKPFKIKIIKEILMDYSIKGAEDVFDYYVLTGGLPKYLELLIENTDSSFEDRLDFICNENSPLLYEGKNLLIEEFGKDYGIYYAILGLIASGKTSRSEIESILERNVGGYIDRLVKVYSVISSYKPINARKNSRLQKYWISDNFLNFWFRFIYRNLSAVETGNFSYLKKYIERDYRTYSGIILEKFFKEIFSDTGKYNRVGSYWESGNKNQIDLVAVNDMEKKIVIAEIKLNKSRINRDILINKAHGLLKDFKGYDTEFLALSIEEGSEGTGLLLPCK
jgi:AAA+ ATPase superfamily predicted ATPase